jgi:hypothetical protein
MSELHLAEKTYLKFSKIEGNQHIASEYALKCALRLIQDFQLKSILEVGIGIGCIADTILESSPNLSYTATEANAFCLNAIKSNVAQIDRVKLYDDLNQIPENTFFDFIIIDGSDDSLAQVKRMCTPKTVIFIEGGRALQVASLKKIFPNVLHAEMLSDYKNPACGPFSSQFWCGGGQLIFPYPNFKMRWYYWKEKWATYQKRKKRKANS